MSNTIRKIHISRQ